MATVYSAQAKKPLNWRMRKKPKVYSHEISTSSPKAVEVSSAAQSTSTSTVRLMGGRWSPEVRMAIEKLILERGSGSPTYDSKLPPVAVMSWTDLAVAGDPAELIFLRMVTDAKFRVDDSWWPIIPVVYGRQPTRTSYENFVSLSTSVWGSQPSYQSWRKGMLSSYLELCRGVGRKECRSYLARLWAGWHMDEAEDFSKRALDDEKKHLGTVEMIKGEPEDRSPLRARRGLRLIPEMRDLVNKLRRAGFDVWVIDDLPQPVLAASVVDYGVDRSRIYGIQNSTDGARMGANVLKPVPIRGGKTEILQMSLGRAADLVIGRDSADFDILAYGDGLRVVIDLDPELVKKAKLRGWLVQERFVR
jgi:phosphoserine phosphatase